MEITLKNFKGVNLKEGLWNEGYSLYAANCDLYGLGDDITKMSYPGVMQHSLNLSSMPQNAISSVANVVSDFAWGDFSGATNYVFGIDAGTPTKIYRWNPSTPEWGWMVSGATGWRGRNIIQYNQNLYYTSASGTAGTANGALGNTSDGTTFQTFQTGLLTADPMPMKVFSGYLYVCHGRYIDRYDTVTYQSQKLVLPVDFTIRSIEVYKDGLYISADNAQYTRIFVWDGASPLFNDSIILSNEAYAPSLIAAQGYLWMVGNRGDANAGTQFSGLTPIYIYQGVGIPELLFDLPIQRNSSFIPNTGVATYLGGILVGSNEVTTLGTNTYELGVAGIWYIGKDLTTGTFHAVNLFSTPQLRGKVIGGIFSSGTTQRATRTAAVYVGFQDTIGSTYNIFQAASSSISPNTVNMEWISLPIDAGSTRYKTWTGIKVNFDQLNTGQQLLIYYRKDDATSWTLLKTFNPDTNNGGTEPTTDRFQQIHLGVRSRTITLRLSISNSSSSIANRVHGITLYYDEEEK